MIAIRFPFTLDEFGKVATTDQPNKLYMDRVLTLLSTNVGQRPTQPEYGIDWKTALFENEGNIAAALPKAIASAVSRWIPDVQVVSVNVSNDSNGTEEVQINLLLPNSSLATLPVSLGIFNIDGTIER